MFSFCAVERSYREIIWVNLAHGMWNEVPSRRWKRFYRLGREATGR